MQKHAIFPENHYATVRDAIEILFNQGCGEAKTFLANKRDEGSLLSAASSFVDFLGSLLTLEECDINEAICSLKNTQKFCELQRNTLKQSKHVEDCLDCLMNEILSTDADLYIAVLTILKQGIKDYVKGAFLIRKAWKQYKKTYEKVLKIGGCFLKSSTDCSQTKSVSCDNAQDVACVSESSPEQCQDSIQNGDCMDSLGIGSIALTEVRAAIAFGYGLFNLIVSLTPPKILQVIQFFGFTGNQELGLICLKYVCYSQDVKAELSRLGLLWFHAVIRPVYAFDNDDVESGLQEATHLLQGLQPKLLMSPVALYFEGLLFRCKGNFNDATKTLQLAVEKPVFHKEIFVFCTYEIGWCYILDMKWDLAVDAFKRVKDATVWSQCFYAYLIGVILGLQGNKNEALIYLKYVPSLVKRKTALGLFLIRKACLYNHSTPDETECLLLLLEIVYLWECLPTCSDVTLSCFLNGLEKPVKDEFVPLKMFLTGYIYQRLGQLSRSIERYKKAISADSLVIGDSHIRPFSLYELGLISVKLSQFNKGRDFLRKAKDVSGGYDFENRLKLKIDIALKRIEEKSRQLSGNHD